MPTLALTLPLLRVISGDLKNSGLFFLQHHESICQFRLLWLKVTGNKADFFEWYLLVYKWLKGVDVASSMVG